jgi:hypothetical protein
LPQAEAAGHIIAQQRVWSIRGIWDPSCAREHEYTERALGLAVRVDDLVRGTLGRFAIVPAQLDSNGRSVVVASPVELLAVSFFTVAPGAADIFCHKSERFFLAQPHSRVE